MPKITSEHGFTISELLVALALTLVVTGTALTTFKNALNINETAGQLADANQNLRAGTNQLVRDLMMAGRIIAGGGVPAPSGNGVLAINRPAPPGQTLTFQLVADDDGVLNIPSITHGYQLGPTINGSKTDMVTMLTVDEFMPQYPGQSGRARRPDCRASSPLTAGRSRSRPTSPWFVGDTVNDTPPINVGDIVLFKNANGSAIQTVTSKDSTHIYFGTNDTQDWFQFNQRSSSFAGTVHCIKSSSACDTLPVSNSVLTATFPSTGVFRALMITYYVDNTTTAGTPRLTRVVNHFTPQALAGVVEDLDLTYDLVDPSFNSVTDIPSLPYTDAVTGVKYTTT